VSSQPFDPDLDTLIWGGLAIAREANLKHPKTGAPNVKQALKLIEAGVIKATRVRGRPGRGGGSRYVTTRRALLSIAEPD
jgi:hypothetical protein